MANLVLILINLVGIFAGFVGFIGGILLISAGEWLLLFYLILAGAIAPFTMAFIMLPSAIISFAAAFLLNKGYKLLAPFFSWLSAMYLGLVFAVWSASIFIYVMNSTETFWGGVFASFGTAISPIFYMASKEQVENDFAQINQTIVMFTAQISLLVMVVMGALNGGTIYEIMTFYALTFAVLSTFHQIFGSFLFKETN